MKLPKILPILLLAVGLAAVSHGQAAGPTGGKLKPGNHANRNRQPVIEALTKVNLTPEEKAKIQELVKARAENIKAFREAHPGDQPGLRAHVADQQKVFLDGIKSVLTPAQWDAFQTELKKIMEEIRANRQKGAALDGKAPPKP
ncbi:MAG TPA: hypothetical protein VKT78_05525 [Fimbriimonadaceae bacterium]|nr:hypothetical protein [Fimbriimonadaceae bacterium]